MNIGWIGLGNMGIPMIQHVGQEHRVEAYNRSQKDIAFSGGVDVTVVGDISEAVSGKSAVVVMVSDGTAVDDVLFASGAVDNMDPNTLIVNMSTIGVDETLNFARRVAERGLRYMDAPVLGSVKPAEAGTLVVVAGGDADDFEVMRPVFERFSKQVFYLGTVGKGATMKLLVNAFLGMSVEAMAETVSFGTKNGFATDLIFSVLESSAVWSPMLAGKRQMVVDGNYAAQFALKHLDKDLGLAILQSEATGAAVPAISSTKRTFGDAVSQGYGDLDMSAMVKFLSSKTENRF